MDKIAEQMLDVEGVLEKIPPQHRGVSFERVLEAFHPQENTCKLERAFAELWAKRNGPDELHGFLLSLMLTDESDPQRERIPKTKREWEVASLVAATLVQWLPTTVGCSFLREAFENGGGSFEYTLPEITD